MSAAGLVAAGGALGAVLRHGVGEAVECRLDGGSGAFPVPTLVVNVAGSFVLAVVAFGAGEGDLLALVGTGACGAFTTFSSFAVETVRLWESGSRERAVANAGLNLVGSSMAVGAGWLLATTVA